MAEPQKLYLLSVSAGHVLAQGSVELVARNPDPSDKTQRWTVELGDEENTFALKNVGNGKYMVAKGGHASALTNTGEKQWWKWSTEDVLAPGAMRLSPKEFPQAYLNHYQGIRVPPGHPGIKVHMWPWDTNLQQWLTWWLMDANGALVSPKQAASPAANGQIASTAPTPTPKPAGGLPSANKQIHITTVCYGQVLTQGKKGFMVSAQPEAGNKSQRWTVEQGEGNLIALKNVETGKYMCAEKDSGWGKIYNNGELTWWKWGTDGCGTAGSVWLQPQLYSKSYLNQHNGEYRRVGQEGVEVHMWGWSKGHDEQFSWRFMDADRDMSGSPQAALSSGSSAQSSEGSSADLDAKTKDLEAREAALKASQKEVEATRSQVSIDKKFLASNQKSYDEESTVLKTQQQAAQTKQKELADREASLAADSKKQADELKQKLEDLQKREATLADRQKEQAAGSSTDAEQAAEKAKAALEDVQARENDLAQKEKESATEREAALKKLQEREKAVGEKEGQLQDVEKREAAVAEKERNSKGLGDVEKQAAELQQQQRDAAEQLRKLATKERSLAQREKNFAAEQAAHATKPGCDCAAKEQDIAKRDRELERREKALAAKERRYAALKSQAAQQPTQSTGSNGSATAAKPSSLKPSTGGENNVPAATRTTKDFKAFTKDPKSASNSKATKPADNNIKPTTKDIKSPALEETPTTKDFKHLTKDTQPTGNNIKPATKDFKPTFASNKGPNSMTKDLKSAGDKGTPVKANTTKQRRPANNTDAGRSAEDERLKQLQDRVEKMEKLVAQGKDGPPNGHAGRPTDSTFGKRTTHRHCGFGPKKIQCRCGWTG